MIDRHHVSDRRQDTLDRLRQVLIDALHLDILPSELDPDTPLFGTGLGLDSIDALELVVAVEDVFGVVVAGSDEGPALALRTLDHLLDRILVAQQGSRLPTPEAAHGPIDVPGRDTSPPTGGTSAMRDGRPVVLLHGDPLSELLALRTGVALAELGHMGLTELVGRDAWDLADRVLPRDLFLRDGQARQTLLLGEDGRVLADVLIASDDDRLLLVHDGLPPAEFREVLLGHRRPGEDARIVDLDQDHVLVEVTGPYAWELMARVDGPGIVGQPYLSIARLGDGTRCLRAGRTGEYAYDVLLPRAQAAAWMAGIEERGQDMEVRRIGCVTLDQAALENWFFNPHAEGRRGLDPLELQLQWRLSGGKDYRGAAALAARRRRGVARRLTAIRGPGGLRPGPLALAGEGIVGEVVVFADAPLLGGGVGLALIDLPLAMPGVDGLVAEGSGQSVRTVSPPFAVNLSLRVKPQRDSFADRARLLASIAART